MVGAALEAVAVAGLLFAPEASILWVAVFAVGQGAAFSLALTFVVLRSPDVRRASQLSALAQSVGYTIAAAGPFALGALHDASDGWNAPLAVLLGLTIPLGLSGYAAGRARLVGSAGGGGDAGTAVE